MSGKLYDHAPPQNIEAERSVLGAMLINPDAVHQAVDVLGHKREGVFFHPAHQHIYEAACGVVERGEPFDIVTLLGELASTGKLEEIGGAVTVSDLVGAVPTSANIRYYAKIVLECWQHRAGIEAATQAAAAAYSGEEEPSKVLTALSAQCEAIISAGMRDEQEPLESLTNRVVEKFESIAKAGKRDTGFPTGITGLDRILGGFERETLSVVAARPSVGKTAAMLLTAVACARAGKHALVFSAEMAADQVAQRIMQSIDEEFSTGNVRETDLLKIRRAAEKLKALPIHIRDRAGMSDKYIEIETRRFVEKHGRDVVVIADYLQLLKAEGKFRSRYEEVGSISARMKNMGRMFNVPVLVGAQLNREAEAMSSGYHMQAALRECGNIEQDADVIIILNKVMLEHQRKEVEKRHGVQDWNEWVEVTVAKYRNGQTGHFSALFDKHRQRFNEVGYSGYSQRDVDAKRETVYDQAHMIEDTYEEDDQPF